MVIPLLLMPTAPAVGSRLVTDMSLMLVSDKDATGHVVIHVRQPFEERFVLLGVARIDLWLFMIIYVLNNI